MSALTHWRRHARGVGRDLGLSRMGTGTKVALGLGAVFAAFWFDANVLGIGLGRINPLGPRTPKTPAPAQPAPAPFSPLTPPTGPAFIAFAQMLKPPFSPEHPPAQVPVDFRFRGSHGAGGGEMVADVVSVHPSGLAMFVKNAGLPIGDPSDPFFVPSDGVLGVALIDSVPNDASFAPFGL